MDLLDQSDLSHLEDEEGHSVDVTVNPLRLLVSVELLDGSPIPDEWRLPSSVNALCVTLGGRFPYQFECVSEAEFLYTFLQGGDALVITAGKLMEATEWKGKRVGISCLIATLDRIGSLIDAKVENRRRIRERIANLESEETLTPERVQSQLDAVAHREAELTRHFQEYVVQQDNITRMVEGLSRQIRDLDLTQGNHQAPPLTRAQSPIPETSSFPNVQGLDFQTPVHSRTRHSTAVDQGMASHYQTVPQIQVRADLDLGRFSGEEPLPKNELTFEQWYHDIQCCQQQYPESILLPALRKSIVGKAKTVLRSLGPAYSVAAALEALSQEYKLEASSDMIFQEFYRLRQEKGERVQVYSVRLREVLSRLKARFPRWVPTGDEDSVLRERLFHGMRSDLRSTVRHLFDRRDTSFGQLLAAARRNELEELEAPTSTVTKVQAKSANVVVENSHQEVHSDVSKPTSPISRLSDQVTKLVAVVKSNWSNSSNKSRDSRSSSVDKKNGTGNKDLREQRGPTSNAAGPFPNGKPPLQCYKCQGWGHTRRNCGSSLNYTRGGLIKEDGNPPQERQGNAQQSQPRTDPQ